jgi:hypothetical protein
MLEVLSLIDSCLLFRIGAGFVPTTCLGRVRRWYRRTGGLVDCRAASLSQRILAAEKCHLFNDLVLLR